MKTKEPQTLQLVRHRESEHESYTDMFLIIGPEAEANPEEAMRAAVADYLKTPTGKDVVRSINFDFNWGDAVENIPNKFWEKHGLKKLSHFGGRSITVNQDEVLCPTRSEIKMGLVEGWDN